MQDMSSSTRGNAEASDPVEDMSTALSRLTFTPLSAILDALTALSDLDLLPSCSIPVKKRDKARHVALHMRDRNARVAPLTRLPRELLDMILTHALVAVPLEKITIVDGQNARMPPLLRVCHALRDPAAEIWYLNTTFHLKDRPDRGILYRWEFPCPGTAPRLRLDCADSLRDVFWTFYPRSSWLETLEERHRSFIRRLFWDPTRGAQLSGPPNQARLDAVSSRLGLRKGALHVPCQFGSAGMYWLDSLQVSIGPPVDMYTVFLHEVLGRKLVKGSFPVGSTSSFLTVTKTSDNDF